MSSQVQIIKDKGKPTFAVVPLDEWEAMMDRLEELSDLADAETISVRIASGSEETFPHEFVEKLVGRQEHPLRLWRTYRGLTLQKLAEEVGVSKPALSMIENGKSQPSARLLKHLATALSCDMEDLITA